jgi:hypothetical protein
MLTCSYGNPYIWGLPHIIQTTPHERMGHLAFP